MPKRVYVWEWPVRLTHWLNVYCIGILCFTGFYIGSPFIQASISDEYPIMAIMRLIHFTTAYFFTMSFFIRIYWAFGGNEYAKVGEFIPVTRKVWGDLWGDVKFYLFLTKKHGARAGHHTLAGITYVLLFIFFHFEIVTGFALYSESHSGFISVVMGGWLLNYFSPQSLRLYHHLVMWLGIIFAMTHIYVGWYNDVVERNSIMSSIFSGYKTLDKE
ncbi:MAG TPA: Ni/Fe-hydrogenase, b-type cytochrome subunit [Thermodesulfobacteriota bacterium]|nr:Ni/Fe-hydrogenase, b-type cytochrome subunit [Thermodesulfobacteriota bacterium]